MVYTFARRQDGHPMGPPFWQNPTWPQSGWMKITGIKLKGATGLYKHVGGAGTSY